MAMSGIAQIALERGAKVSGSDLTASPYTERLACHGARISIGHCGNNLGGAELVVHSASIPCANPELREARRRQLPIISRADFIAELLSEKQTIAVAGTHGKTSTAAMVAYALSRLGMDPAYLVGAYIPQLRGNAAWGRGEQMVVEADEYAKAFLAYRPAVAVIGHLEPDHLDYYGSEAGLYEAFAGFAGRVLTGGALVARTEIAQVDSACQASTARVVSFGFSGQWRLVSQRPAGTGQVVTISGPEKFAATAPLAVPGEHNALNALAATAALAQIGVDPANAFAALADFAGTDRRFSLAMSGNAIRIYDDYAHHPTEIAAAIAAARGIEPVAKRLWVVFQPHLRSRTANLFGGFAQALQGADKVTICHIYSPPGRDNDHAVSAADLAAAVGPQAGSAANFGDAYATITLNARAGDLILCLGAGDIVDLSARLASWLEERR